MGVTTGLILVGVVAVWATSASASETVSATDKVNTAAQMATWPEFMPTPTTTKRDAVSLAFLLDAPAGKHGFVSVKDGHFVFDDGAPARFWGTNILYAGDVPTHEQAEAVSDTLARYGINIVRFHLPATGITVYDANQKKYLWDDDHWDRFDYFVKCLKDRGIYLLIDAITGLNWRSVQSYSDLGYKFPSPYPGAACYFDPQLRKIAREFMTMYLTRKNKYTGTTLATEPAVAMGLLLNETGLFWGFGGDNATLDPYYVEMLRKQYCDWLVAKYGDRAGLAKAWALPDHTTALKPEEDPAQANVELPTYSVGFFGNDRAPLRAAADPNAKPADRIRAREALAFFQHVVGNFRDEFTSLARECGAKFPILVNNYYVDISDLKTAVPTGVISQHAYWDHVGWTEKGLMQFSNHPEILNCPVGAPYATHPIIASRRVAGCALITTETDVMWPEEFRATHMMMMGAVGALQRMDAIFHFCFLGGYSASWDQVWDRKGALHPAMEWADPATLSSIMAGSLLYLRGDVSGAKSTVEITLDDNQQWMAGYRENWVMGLSPATYLTHVSAFQTRYPDQPKTASSAPSQPASVDYTLPLSEFSGNDPFTALDRKLKAKKVIPNEAGWHPIQGAVVSDTRQLVYHYGAGLYLVRTPRSQGFIGFPSRQPIQLGDVRILCKSPFAVMQLSAIDGKTLAESQKMLLIATGRSNNRDLKVTYDTAIAMPNGGYRGEGMKAEGGSVGPMVIEPIRAQLTLAGRNVRVTPLNPDMTPRTAAAHSFSSENGNVTISLPEKSDSASVWYLVERLADRP
jgi:hypothetical protein